VQYQNAAQKSGIQLQAARLEASIAQSRVRPLKQAVVALQAEVATLRSTPVPPPPSPHEPNGTSGTALSELSLAHRRLSAKMDATEQNLHSSQLELASAKQEIQRLTQEREDDRAKLNELRRREGEWEEEMLWEKTEKRKAEEQKKLWCVQLNPPVRNNCDG
jgi:DNA repair exonuclease SbcCD ATPase subunit